MCLPLCPRTTALANVTSAQTQTHVAYSCTYSLASVLLNYFALLSRESRQSAVKKKKTLRQLASFLPLSAATGNLLSRHLRTVTQRERHELLEGENVRLQPEVGGIFSLWR